MSGVGTFRDLAALLRVSSKQVYMWHKRRANNGFPEAVACTLVPQYPGDKKRSSLFDVQAVIDWWVAYEPNKGGAPKGNTFALKHGRFVNFRGTRTPEEVRAIREQVSA